MVQDMPLANVDQVFWLCPPLISLCTASSSLAGQCEKLKSPWFVQALLSNN